MASRTVTTPKPPCASHFHPAVVSFESGGQIIALGNIFRKSQDEDIKVAFTIKHRGIESPYLGFRIKLKRDLATWHLHRNFQFLIFFKYHNGCFDCIHHTANEMEKKEFLGIMPNDAACKEVVDNDKLYVVRLFKKDDRGPEVTGCGIRSVGTDAKTADTFDHLYSVHTSSVVTVWLFEYKNLVSHVEWALEYLKTADLKPCYDHPHSKSCPEHEPSVFISASQNGAAPSATEKPTDSFPIPVDNGDQSTVGRGAGFECAATTNATPAWNPTASLGGWAMTSLLRIWKG